MRYIYINIRLPIFRNRGARFCGSLRNRRAVFYTRKRLCLSKDLQYFDSGPHFYLMDPDGRPLSLSFQPFTIPSTLNPQPRKENSLCNVHYLTFLWRIRHLTFHYFFKKEFKIDFRRVVDVITFRVWCRCWSAELHLTV